VTRVFSKSQSGRCEQWLSPHVQFAREQPVFAVERQLEADRLKTMSLSFSIALNQLPLGEYDCQVTVLDPTAQKAAFWRAPVKLVP